MFPIDLFYRQARFEPDRIAVEHGEEALSYGELLTKSLALARGLQSLDPQPGSRVGVCCFNHVEHVICWLATLAAGKVWVPLYPKNKSEEIQRAIDYTEMSIVIADPEIRTLVEGGRARVVVTGPDQDRESLGGLLKSNTGARPEFHALPLHEPQAIKFTGGSTGAPKGVMQPYRAWNANIVTQILAWKLRAGDRFLAAAPITHGTSTYILPTLATGGTLILLDRPRPEEILTHLRDNRIATTFAPPTVIYTMMDIPGVDGMSFGGLRNLVYGSAPMRPEAIRKAQEIFGPCIASTYGQTEAPQIATMISAKDLARPDKLASVGRETILTRVAIMGEDGRPLPPGEVGEIAIRGDLVMTGYWRQPEKTAETIRDGWLRTGDLGEMDEEGFLFIKGRLKDVIITGGFNVYPSDVEPIIASHEGVSDCAVFGTPDRKWGEAVRAAVELRSGARADPEDIIRFVKERLGSVKAPKSVTIYDRLPRNPYGKLQKQALVDDFIRAAEAKEHDA